ncbi:MAG TPA: hypothetical protein VIF57_07725 [Polyangia bacterium]|jgi:hypothetical protein
MRAARGLRSIGCAGALLISCAHGAGGPATVHDDLLGTLRRCATTVVAVEPDRVAAGAVGETLPVRGVLVPDAALATCTERACREVDRVRHLSRSAACCNWCGVELTLRSPRDAAARTAATTKVRVQLRGQVRPLSQAIQDCELGASDARARPEVVVTGVVRSALTESGVPTRVLDDAELCATGSWSAAGPAPARPPDGPWRPDRSNPIELGPIEPPPAAPPAR